MSDSPQRARRGRRGGPRGSGDSGGRVGHALLRRRLTAQGLAGPVLGDGAAGPAAVAERLLAIQAQDPRGARLAIRARSRGTTGPHVDRAFDGRSLVVTWLNRGTLHLCRAEDYPLLQALTTPPLRTSTATRLAQCGVDSRSAERAVRLIDRRLADEGPLSRVQLAERLRGAGYPLDGQALVHILVRASLDGVLVRGPVDPANGQQLHVRVDDWLPGARAEVQRLRGGAPRERALAELAHRFLAGHGPADDRDLARWAGISLGDARRGLTAIASRLDDAGGGLVALSPTPIAGRLRGPRLLGPFEPVLMGWRSRAPVLGDHADAIVTGGIFRGFACVAGRAAGVWRFAGREVALEPLTPLAPATLGALERDASALIAFLGR